MLDNHEFIDCNLLQLNVHALKWLHTIEDENRPVNISVPCCVVQSVICLSADKEVASSIPAQSHTFLQIDHELFTTAILLLLDYSKRVVVRYKQKYVHEILVKSLVKLRKSVVM